MGLVLHVRLVGQRAPLVPGFEPAARLLQPPTEPPPEEWPPGHPLLPLLEAAASLTPRVEPISEDEFFAGLDRDDASHLAPFVARLDEGAALAVLASSRLIARAAGVRFLLDPLPPGQGRTWERPAPAFYRILDPARFLAPLPLGYLWTLPEKARDLQRLGIWQIGQLSPVSRDLLADRLGLTLARQVVDASLGIDPTPVRIAFPRPAVRLERSLPDDFDGSGLEGILRPMVLELSRELDARGLGASRLTLCLTASDGARGKETSGNPAGVPPRSASRRLAEPTGDPRRFEREGLRLARGLLGNSFPPRGGRLVLEADLLAPLQVHQAARLVATGEAPEVPPVLTELLEQTRRRFGQAAPVPASHLPISRRERMLRLWGGLR